MLTKLQLLGWFEMRESSKWTFICMQLKKARVGGSAEKSKASAVPAIGGSAGGGILIDSDSDDGVPPQPAATARFGGRRLGEITSLVIHSASFESVLGVLDRLFFVFEGCICGVSQATAGMGGI